ncbi:MAG: AAA family ATPase [Egibacteraceae bacterium]
MPGQWPLTGRVEELRLIGELTRHRDGPAGVVLAGASGVGKTRLAREALAAAEQRGALVRWAVATASARILPLGAFGAMLGTVGADQSRLVRQATDALLAGAARPGVVVGVDDAHLLDELSALLVHDLALRRAARVVLTLRTGEAAPDAVTALWKDGHLARLELQPLSQEETATLLQAVLGGPVDSAPAMDDHPGKRAVSAAAGRRRVGGGPAARGRGSVAVVRPAAAVTGIGRASRGTHGATAR